MSVPFLNNINMNKNEVQNMVVQNLANPPSGANKVGQIYYDTDAGEEGKVYICTVAGTPGTWVAVHGNLAGGSLHSNASTSTAGFLSGADKTKLDNATNLATVSTLMMRDASGKARVVTPAGGDDATTIATKGYVDGVLDANDAMQYKGVIDASANPNYPAANAGHVYIISVAGKIGGASGPNVEVGDKLLCRTDSTSAGTHAAVGAQWNIFQTNIDGAVTGPASSVAGNFAAFSGVTGKIISDSGNKAADFAAAIHTHGNISSTGYLGVTANIPLITGVSGIIQAGSFGSAANTFCQGNDSRLADARTPTTHAINTHSATNWRLFHSNGSGAVVELALGTSGQVLQSNGASAAPTWVTPAGGAGLNRFAKNNAAGTTETITHNLGTLDVIVQIYDIGTGAQVYTDVTLLSTTQIRVDWALSLTAGLYRIVIIG